MSLADPNHRNLRDVLSSLKRGLIDAREARSAVASGDSALEKLHTGAPVEAGRLAELLGLESDQQDDAELRRHIDLECEFLEGVPFQPGERIGGRYEVLQILRGGFGLVYLCRGLHLEQYRRGDALAALKSPLPHHLVDHELCAQFVSEAVNSVALSSHPNLVLAYGVEMHNRIPFLVMEHITGGRTLAQEIVEGRTDWRTTIRHGLGMARGLAHAAKEAQMVHGDLKPANVLITKEGTAKVSDFGLSLTGGDSDPEGLIAGTDGFMAPEMLARRSGRSTAADVYAFGVTLLCSVIGEHPNVPDLSIFCDSSRMPGPLAEILRQCLSTDPASRPSGFPEIVSRMEKLFPLLLEADPPDEASPDAPHRADAMVNAAQTWLNLDQVRKAQAEAKKALSLDAKNWKAHQILGCIQLEQRDFEAAFRSFSEAGKLAPDEISPAANLAQAAMNLGRRDEASQWAEHAIRLARHRHRMAELDGMSMLIIELFPPAQACSVIDAILADQPGAAITWNNRAVLMRRMKRPEEALESAERAISLNAAYAKAWVNRANAQVELHRFAEAEISASQALDLDLCLPGAYCAKATALAQLDRLSEARAVIRSGLSVLPHDPLLARAAQMFGT